MRASPATFKWLGLALLGIAIAAAIAVAASSLASREIGLASEPLRAGRALAPAAREEGDGTAGSDGGRPATVSPELSPSAPSGPSPAPTPEGDDERADGDGETAGDD